MVQRSQFLGHTAVLQEFIRGEEFTVANCIGFVCPDAASGLVMKLSDLVVGKFFFWEAVLTTRSSFISISFVSFAAIVLTYVQIFDSVQYCLAGYSSNL